MSTEPKPKKITEQNQDSPVLNLKCRVLINGFKIAGGVAAKGKELKVRMTDAQMVYHEERGELKRIPGTF